MPTPAQLFRLLNEMIFVLLGGLLFVLAASRRYSLPDSRAVWLALGALLVYWGLRAWWKPGSYGRGWPTHVRGGSLVLVGLLVITIAFARPGHVAALLGAAGVVLALRGLAGAALALRGF